MNKLKFLQLFIFIPLQISRGTTKESIGSLKRGPDTGQGGMNLSSRVLKCTLPHVGNQLHHHRSRHLEACADGAECTLLR